MNDKVKLKSASLKKGGILSITVEDFDPDAPMTEWPGVVIKPDNKPEFGGVVRTYLIFPSGHIVAVNNE